MASADAVERELHRLAEVRRRRAARDQLRVQAAQAELDASQRRPLLTRVHATAVQLLRRRRTEARVDGRRRRDEETWERMALPASAEQEWRQLGFESTAQAETALRALREASTLVNPNSDVNILDPAQLRQSVVDMLKQLPAEMGVAIAADLADTPLLPVSPTIAAALIELGASSLGVEFAPKPSALWSPAWLNWSIALTMRTASALRPADLRLEVLELQVLETLIEKAPTVAMHAAARRPGDPQSRYVRARIDPRVLDDEDLSHLEWPYERHRRNLIDGVLDDAEVGLDPLLRACATLLRGEPNSKQLAVVAKLRPGELVEDLQRLHDGGPVTHRMTLDATTWRLVEACVDTREGRASDDLPADALGVWLILRRARRNLYGRRVEAGHDAVGRGLELTHDNKSAAAELQTIGSLLYGLTGDTRRSRMYAKRARMSFESEYTVHNEAVAERSTDPRRLSPFAVIGVDWEDDAWELEAERRYRETWRKDPDATTEINWAQAVLADPAHDLARWMRFPLKPFLFQPPHVGTGVLLPSPTPLKPRFDPLQDSDLVALRHGAWADIISSL